jgi:hypothetical protein
MACGLECAAKSLGAFVGAQYEQFGRVIRQANNQGGMKGQPTSEA